MLVNARLSERSLNKYQKIYNKNTGYNPANKWNKRTFMVTNDMNED